MCQVFVSLSTVRKQLKNAGLEAGIDMGRDPCLYQIAGHFAKFLVASVDVACSETLSWHGIEWHCVWIRLSCGPIVRQNGMQEVGRA